MKESKLRELRLELANWRCEWSECRTRDDLELAHLTPKGMGGRHRQAETEVNSLSNVLMLCHFHHMIQEGETTQGRKREVTLLLQELNELRGRT